MIRHLALFLFPLLVASPGTAQLTYPIVDTGKTHAYDTRRAISFPEPAQPFYGQDAQFAGSAPSYRVHDDGTVTDLVTGLMWTRDPGEKKTFTEAVRGADACRVGGYTAWRLPTIKELYPLINFDGMAPDPRSSDVRSLVPFTDDEAFAFRYGDTRRGERIIDAQFATGTRYVSTTMHGNETMFGVSFADGHIRGYPITSPSAEGLGSCRTGARTAGA